MMKRIVLTAAMSACLGVHAEICTYTDGAWDVAPSGEDDEIVIVSGNLTWGATLPSKVASWTQTGGTVTFQTVFPGQGDFELFEVTGDVSLTGGTWTHSGNSNTEKYRLNVACGGNFTVGENAEINVTACGYANAGPGRIDTHCGGAYGGQGTGYEAQPVTPCYGSITKPVNLGSSGRSNNHKGGGAVRLLVAGALTVNGQIFAEGQTKDPLDAYYGGAGGSVWVTAAALAGAGEISASAGRQRDNYYGGGGRVALYLTGNGADFSEFTGSVYAYPCRNGSLDIRNAAAGTVYYETAADGEGKGRLVIDRGSSAGTLADSATTDIILDDQEATFDPKEIVLENGATMCVTTGARKKLTIGEKLTMDGNTKLIVKDATLDLTTATIAHAGTGKGLIQLSGTTVKAENLVVPAAVDVQVSGESAVEASTVTVAQGGTLTIDTPLAVTGNVVVKDGGLITHTKNGDTEKYKVDLSVGGNMTVEKGGRVDVSTKGYGFKKGPGCCELYYGSSHGGKSYNNQFSKVGRGVCYGSLVYPFTLGSNIEQGDYPGGGAAKLTVAGTLTVDGSILALGGGGTNPYNSSGGSLWITAAFLAGTEGSAVISANAAERTKAFNYNNSGGGRVAIHLTGENADFSAYAGAITAYGTKGNRYNGASQFYGGAGTVYLKEGNEAALDGTLIIDNGIEDYNQGGVTEIGPEVTDTEIGSVVLRNGGRLKLLAGQRLGVRRDWTNEGGELICEADAGFNFVGSGISRINSDLSISAFVCQTPGKEIVFAEGVKLDVAANGRLQVEGDAEHAVTLRCETEETTNWWLCVDAAAAQSVNAVSVADCDASSGALVSAVNSTLTRTANWKNSTVVVGQTVTWTGGAGSGAWMAAGNWDAERAPLATDRIVIAPAAVPPVLSDDFVAMDLTVQSGATFDLNAKTFRTTGRLTVAGTVVSARGGKLVANGDADFTGATVDTPWLALELAGDGKAVQTFAGGGCAFFCMTVIPQAAGVSVAGGFAAKTLACEATDPFAMSFAPGICVAVDSMLTLTGPIVLGSTAVGQMWDMSVKAVRNVSGVTVSDCASDFTAPPVVWTGAVDGDFGKPGNWSTGALPGEGDCVVIGAGTVKAGAAISVGSLWLKDGAKVSVDKGGSVAGTVYLASGATLAHTANTTTEANRLMLDIGGDLIVEDGAAIDVSGQGYKAGASAPGVSGPVNSGGSYAGRGETHTSTDNVEGRTYGSLLNPTDLGAGGVNTAGGGAIILTVQGLALVDGTMTATGAKSGNYYGGSGGTVNLSAAVLRGEGCIEADGAAFPFDYAASGGRIAVRLTAKDASFADFGGQIHAYPSSYLADIPSHPRGSAGTVYYETAADGDGCGQVVIDSSATGTRVNGNTRDPKTDYPAQKRSSGAKEAKNATVVLRNTVGLNITADAKIGNLVVEGTKPRIYLNGHTLKVNTDRPADWPRGGELPSFVIPGTDADGNPGQILWKSHFIMMIR